MLLKRADVVIVAVVLLFAALIYIVPVLMASDADSELLITVNGEEYRRIPLSDKNYTEIIEIEGDYHNTIEVKDGTAAFIYADCPDKDCVKAGKLNETHGFAACLPNHVSISIVAPDREIDSIVG